MYSRFSAELAHFDWKLQIDTSGPLAAVELVLFSASPQFATDLPERTFRQYCNTR